MPKYESTFVVQPQIPEEEFQSIRKGFEQVIRSGGGTVLQTETWGKKRLAYRVKKYDEGHFGFILFEGSGSIIHELERRLRLNENVIKFLTVNAPPEGARVVGSAEGHRSRPEPGSSPEAPAAPQEPGARPPAPGPPSPQEG